MMPRAKSRMFCNCRTKLIGAGIGAVFFHLLIECIFPVLFCLIGVFAGYRLSWMLIDIYVNVSDHRIKLHYHYKLRVMELWNKWFFVFRFFFQNDNIFLYQSQWRVKFDTRAFEFMIQTRYNQKMIFIFHFQHSWETWQR